MPIENLHCSSCGAPLTVDPKAEFCFCSYCGARLRLHRDASGQMAVALEGVHDDTAFLARDRAYQLLQERYAQLSARRKALYNEWAAARAPVQAEKTSCAWYVLGILLLPVLIGIIFLAIPIIQACNRRARLKRIDAHYGPQMAHLDAEIRSVQSRMASVNAERDQYINRL